MCTESDITSVRGDGCYSFGEAAKRKKYRTRSKVRVVRNNDERVTKV